MAVPGSFNNICVFGIGGVGGYFGGKISDSLSKNKKSEEKVFFIARGKHLDEIKKSGLILNTSSEGTLYCRPEKASDKISDIPSPDLVLLCVKSYSLETAVSDLSEAINGRTVIIPLLNGVDIYDRIRSKLKKGIVLPACVYVGTHIEKPGTVTQNGGDGVVIFGRDPLYRDYAPQRELDLFDKTGIKYKWEPDPYPAIWEKYVFIASFGLVTAAYGKTIGEVLSDGELKNKAAEIMKEIFAIALKKGIKLQDSVIEQSMLKAARFPYETKTSYQRDCEEKNKQNEGDLFGKTIVRMGIEEGISTQATESVIAGNLNC